jgi:hypothetical protein
MIILGAVFNIIVFIMRKKISPTEGINSLIMGYLFVGFSVMCVGVMQIIIDMNAIHP